MRTRDIARLLCLVNSVLLAVCFVSGCGDGGSSDFGSALNADYKIYELKCDGPTSANLSQSGLTLEVSNMSPCVEAHVPQVSTSAELPERMTLADYETNITSGAVVYDVELGLRDFSHHSAEVAKLTLKLDLNRQVVAGANLTSDTVLARIYDLDDDTLYDLTGELEGNKFTVSTPSIPNHFYVAMIYNPNMRSIASDRITAGDWAVRRWCVLYDAQNPAIVQSAAILYGTTTPSEEQERNAISTLILDNIERANAEIAQSDFASPSTKVANSANEPCSELGGEPRYLLYYEMINRDVAIEPGIYMLSLPQYTFGVFNLKSQLSYTPPTASAKGKAFPTPVNGQITDSVTQVNTKVLGDSPAVAMGNLYVATAQALSNAMHNATFAQQQTVTSMQATSVQGLSTLYSIDTVTTGIATSQILSDLTIKAAETPSDICALDDDVFYLDNWLLTSSFPRSNQDFFAYVGRRYNHGSLSYLSSLIQEVNNAVVVAASAAESAERQAGILFDPELKTVRTAIDSYFQKSFGVGLVQSYLEFIAARAVIHDRYSYFRDGDVETGFAKSVFRNEASDPDYAGYVELTPSGSNLTPTKATFSNVAPFAARAIYISADTLTTANISSLNIKLSASDGVIGDSIQGLVCQGQQCNAITGDILLANISGASDDIVILIANVAMEGINDVSFSVLAE